MNDLEFVGDYRQPQLNARQRELGFDGQSDSEFTFGDFLDIINPLQHIPVISSLYREITGDTISPHARIMGGTLFGGPSGFISSVVNTIYSEVAGFDRRRVMGIGGILDCTRMAHFVADELGISPRDITAMVIGSHTKSMVPVPEFTRVNGIPIAALMSPERVERIVEETLQAGSVIIELSRSANAFYAPGAAIAQVAEAVSFDTCQVLSLSVMLDGEYGVSGAALSVPCRVGAAGVEEILDVELDEPVLRAFRDSAETVHRWFREGGEAP